MCIRDRGTSGELSTNGIDDDGNGKVDDWHGWDFIGNGSAQSPNPDNNPMDGAIAVSYTHLRAHETVLDLVCRLLLEKKKKQTTKKKKHNKKKTKTKIKKKKERD